MAKITYGEKNDTNLKLIITLIRCFQSVRRSEESWIKEHGLTFAQFMVLEILYHKGECTVGDIIEKTQSTPGTITVVIDNLVRERLITKERDNNDKRHFIIHITESGKTLISNFFPIHMDNLDKRFDVLTDEEKHTMIELCKKLGKGQ